MTVQGGDVSVDPAVWVSALPNTEVVISICGYLHPQAHPRGQAVTELQQHICHTKGPSWRNIGAE